MVIPWLYHGYTMVIPWLYHYTKITWSPNSEKKKRSLLSFSFAFSASLDDRFLRFSGAPSVHAAAPNAVWATFGEKIMPKYTLKNLKMEDLRTLPISCVHGSCSIFLGRVDLQKNFKGFLFVSQKQAEHSWSSRQQSSGSSWWSGNPTLRPLALPITHMTHKEYEWTWYMDTTTTIAPYK